LNLPWQKNTIAREKPLLLELNLLDREEEGDVIRQTAFKCIKPHWYINESTLLLYNYEIFITPASVKLDNKKHTVPNNLSLGFLLVIK
jgi:hypothetical protein